MQPLRLAAAAVMALLLAAPVSGQQPAQVTVQVWSFGFAPNPIRLVAGQPVTMTFVNQSGGSHDFSAPGFFKHARITAGAAPDDEIELRGHETRRITLIPTRGTYQAHCSHFFHKQLGMSDAIIVQ